MEPYSIPSSVTTHWKLAVRYGGTLIKTLTGTSTTSSGYQNCNVDVSPDAIVQIPPGATAAPSASPVSSSLSLLSPVPLAPQFGGAPPGPPPAHPQKP